MDSLLKDQKFYEMLHAFAFDHLEELLDFLNYFQFESYYLKNMQFKSHDAQKNQVLLLLKDKEECEDILFYFAEGQFFNFLKFINICFAPEWCKDCYFFSMKDVKKAFSDYFKNQDEFKDYEKNPKIQFFDFEFC